MMKKASPATFFARGAAIAALYAVLSVSFSPFGALQLRVSEALSVLPFFFPEAVFGLTLGCAIVNLFSPFGMIDVVFGSLATFLGAYLTYKIGRRSRAGRFSFYLAPLPSVLSNALIVGAILYFMLMPTPDAAPYTAFVLSIGVSQFFSCYILGLPLLFSLRRTLFKNSASL